MLNKNKWSGQVYSCLHLRADNSLVSGPILSKYERE